MEQAFFSYLSALSQDNVPLETREDLELLTSRQLLELANRMDEGALGYFVQILKSSSKGPALFNKLMGDHEEENRVLVNDFFSRYMNALLAEEEELSDINPLVYYLPTEALDDLVFLSSREKFFKKQTAATINEFFFITTGRETNYITGEEDQAFAHLWNWVLARKAAQV